MNSNTEAHKREIERVESYVLEATHQIETEGGDIRLFAFSMLRAGAELTAFLEGSEAMSAAMFELVKRQDLRDGRAGKA